MHVAFDLGCRCIFGYIEVILRLESHPELPAGPEVAGKAKSGICRNAALFVHDSANARGWDTKLHGQPVHTDPSRIEKLLAKHLAGMEWRDIFFADWHGYILL